MFLENIINNKRVLVFVGSGGVGKTSISAALALYASTLGKNVLILTIDPSKRLADTLGIDIKSTKRVEVDLSSIKKENKNIGKLYAIVLDMKSTIDRLVKNNISEENQEKLLKNKAYKSFSTNLAGVYEFAAMEVLWEVSNNEEYDLIVLDTPPTTNALDFFTFPEKIFDTIDNKIARVLISIYNRSKKFNFNFINMSTQILLRTINKFTGTEMLENLSSFLYYFSDLLDIVKIRSKEVNSLLRSSKVAYMIVTSPKYSNIEEAKYFREELLSNSFDLEALIVNKSYLEFEDENFKIKDVDILKKILTRIEFEDEKYNVKKTIEKLIENTNQLNSLSKQENYNLKNIEEKIIKIPLFKNEIYNLNTLMQVVSFFKKNLDLHLNSM